MKLPRRQFLHLAAGAAALPAASRIAMTQPYPLRPITIVVPYAAGGATDLIARVLGDRMGFGCRSTRPVNGHQGRRPKAAKERNRGE
jgi:hypothetical protein